MVKETILKKETKVSPDKGYGVVKIQSKLLNPFLGDMVDVYIRKKEPEKESEGEL